MDIFIAGSETTSTTLSWAVLFMILNPDVQKKVQDEMDEVFGRERNITIGDRWIKLKEKHSSPFPHENEMKFSFVLNGICFSTLSQNYGRPIM